MATENTYADLLSNGGRVAEMITPQLHQTLWDPTDLRAVVPRIPYPGQGGSAVTTIVKIPAPPTAAAVSSETSGGTSNTAFTTSEAQLTLACQQVQVTSTDLAEITAGVLASEQVVMWLSNALGLRITDMVTALFPSLATSVGQGSGDPMTVDLFYAAMYKLNLSNNGGPIALVLANKSHNELVESLRGEGGALQYDQSVVGMLGAKGPGYKGSMLNVDVWQSDSISSSGGALRNAMFSAGCFAHQIGPIQRLVGLHIDPADVIMSTPDMLIERSRDAGNNMSTFYLKFYAAVTEVEDLRGVLVNVDA